MPRLAPPLWRPTIQEPIFALLYPAIYEINVTKTGYSNHSINVNAPVISNGTITVLPVFLVPNTVTVTTKGTIGIAGPGQNVSFNLTVINSGDNATFNVEIPDINPGMIVTNATYPSPLLLNRTIASGYVVVEVNNSNYGVWPITITISNSSQSKIESVTLATIIRNSSENYTNINSAVDANSTVIDATIMNTTVEGGAIISGNMTLIMDTNVVVKIP